MLFPYRCLKLDKFKVKKMSKQKNKSDLKAKSMAEM